MIILFTVGASESPPAPTLTANDRCDVCGSRAYVRVTMSEMRELLWCAHHGREVEPVLRPIAAFWDDESAELG